jgi:hypothetical protein
MGETKKPVNVIIIQNKNNYCRTKCIPTKANEESCIIKKKVSFDDRAHQP